MKKWLNNLFAPRGQEAASTGAADAPEAPPDSSAVDDRLALQKEIQSLRLELDQRQRSLANLTQEIERLRQRQDELLKETVTSRLEGIFTDLAGPASQVLTQADLLENQGKPVQARDVLSVARRMVRALERNGIIFEEQIGQPAVFDPNRHTPINAASAPQPGQPVTVRFSGVSYQGKIIYKAIVE